MISTGTIVRIRISEPWDSNIVIVGPIVRISNEGNYYVMRDSESRRLYVITSRYMEIALNDQDRSDVVTVEVSIPNQGFDVMMASDINPENMGLLEYRYIGSMSLANES